MGGFDLCHELGVGAGRDVLAVLVELDLVSAAREDERVVGLVFEEHVPTLAGLEIAQQGPRACEPAA